jgi:hypothetical protein
MIQNCDKNQFINLEGLYNNCFYVLLNKNLANNLDYDEYLGDIKTQNQPVNLKKKQTKEEPGLEYEALEQISKSQGPESGEPDKVKKVDKILQERYEKENDSKKNKQVRDKKIQKQKEINKEEKEKEEEQKKNRVIELNSKLSQLKSKESPNDDQMAKLRKKFPDINDDELINRWKQGKPQRLQEIEDELDLLDPGGEIRLLGGAKTEYRLGDTQGPGVPINSALLDEEEETYLFIFKLDLDTENPNSNMHIFSDLCKIKNGPYEEVGIGDLCTYDGRDAVITNMTIIENPKDGSLSYFFDIKYFDDGTEEKKINPTITTGGWIFKTNHKFEVTGRNLVKKINGICINVTNFSKLNNKSPKTYLQLLDLNNNKNFYNTASIKLIPNDNNCILDLHDNGTITSNSCTIYENDYSDMINKNIVLMNQQNYLLNKYKNELEFLLEYFITSSAYNYLNCSTIFYYDVFKIKIRYWATYYKTLWEMMLKQEKKKQYAQSAAAETLKKATGFVKGQYDKMTIGADKKEGNQLLAEYKKYLAADQAKSTSQTIQDLIDVENRIQQFANLANNKDINILKTELTDDENRGNLLVTDYNKAVSAHSSSPNPASQKTLDDIEKDITTFVNLRKNPDIIRITGNINKKVVPVPSAGPPVQNQPPPSAAPVVQNQPPPSAAPVVQNQPLPSAGPVVQNQPPVTPSSNLGTPPASGTPSASGNVLSPGGGSINNYRRRKAHKTKKIQKRYKNKTKKLKRYKNKTKKLKR